MASRGGANRINRRLARGELHLWMPVPDTSASLQSDESAMGYRWDDDHCRSLRTVLENVKGGRQIRDILAGHTPRRGANSDYTSCSAIPLKGPDHFSYTQSNLGCIKLGEFGSRMLKAEYSKK